MVCNGGARHVIYAYTHTLSVIYYSWEYTLLYFIFFHHMSTNISNIIIIIKTILYSNMYLMM